MAYQQQRPDWLQKQHDNSWQIEFLIAGGIVITLYQLPDYFRRYFILTYETTILDDFILLLLFSVYLFSRILLIGFVVNLILRAIWIAFIGVYASFPKGINKYDHAYSKWLGEKYQKENASFNRLEWLDKAASLSYVLAILLSLMTLSMVILMYVGFWLINIIPTTTYLDSAWFKYTLLGFIVLFSSGILEALFYRLFQQPTRFRGWGQRFFTIMDYLTLGVFYKKEWYTLVSNTKRGVLPIILLLYFLFATLVTINQIGSYLHLDGFFHYDFLDDRDYRKMPRAYEINITNYYNLIPEKKFFAFEACISEDIVDERYMWVFVSYWEAMDDELGAIFEEKGMPNDYSAIETREDLLSVDSLYISCLQELFLIDIDGQQLDSLRWFETQLGKTAEYGYMAYIDTKDLSSGQHYMHVQRKGLNYKKEWYTSRIRSIPFIKE